MTKKIVVPEIAFWRGDMEIEHLCSNCGTVVQYDEPCKVEGKVVLCRVCEKDKSIKICDDCKNIIGPEEEIFAHMELILCPSCGETYRKNNFGTCVKCSNPRWRCVC